MDFIITTIYYTIFVATSTYTLLGAYYRNFRFPKNRSLQAITYQGKRALIWGIIFGLFFGAAALTLTKTGIIPDAILVLSTLLGLFLGLYSRNHGYYKIKT